MKAHQYQQCLPAVTTLKTSADAAMVAHLSAVHDGDDELARATRERFIAASAALKRLGDLALLDRFTGKGADRGRV